MSAMPKETVDWREVFNAEVRGIQAQYPKAHEALKNWGLWSRETGGIFPVLAKPGWTEFYSPDPGEGWGEVENIPAPVEEVKGERANVEHSDERSAIELDIRIHHDPEFPIIWRNVLKAAYVTLEIPEYEYPRVAGIKGHGDYLMFLDGALAFVEMATG